MCAKGQLKGKGANFFGMKMIVIVLVEYFWLPQKDKKFKKTQRDLITYSITSNNSMNINNLPLNIYTYIYIYIYIYI